MNRTLTKEDFLARCANAYDVGLITPELMQLLATWTDAMLRLEHSIFTIGGQSQLHYVWDFLTMEKERVAEHSNMTLASDAAGYKLVELTALLSHPCQECATSQHAWWTRPGWCDHKEV
jgi:hypothetical protein